MKKCIIFTVAAALCLIACNKSGVTNGHGMEGEGPVGMLSIRIDTPVRTKAAAGDVLDNQINSAQVLVYDQTGLLETSRFFDVWDQDKATVTCQTGQKVVYVLLNVSNANRIKSTSLAQLEKDLSDLAENTPSNLIMSGRAEPVVTEYNKNKDASAAPQEVSVHVKRLASKVELQGVNVNFNNTQLEGASFQIKEIYLKNVVGKSPVTVQSVGKGGDEVNTTGLPSILSDTDHANASYWYSPMTKQVTGAPEVTYEVFASTDGVCVTTNDTPTAVNRALFAYPNKNTGDNHDSTFNTGKKTRLVIKAHVTTPVDSPYISTQFDDDTYYVFELPKLEANKVYRITGINITMLGLTKEEEEIDEENEVGIVKPLITVDPWSEIIELTYES